MSDRDLNDVLFTYIKNEYINHYPTREMDESILFNYVESFCGGICYRLIMLVKRKSPQVYTFQRMYDTLQLSQRQFMEWRHYYKLRKQITTKEPAPHGDEVFNAIQTWLKQAIQEHYQPQILLDTDSDTDGDSDAYARYVESESDSDVDSDADSNDVPVDVPVDVPIVPIDEPIDEIKSSISDADVNDDLSDQLNLGLNLRVCEDAQLKQQQLQELVEKFKKWLKYNSQAEEKKEDDNVTMYVISDTIFNANRVNLPDSHPFSLRFKIGCTHSFPDRMASYHTHNPGIEKWHEWKVMGSQRASKAEAAMKQACLVAGYVQVSDTREWFEQSMKKQDEWVTLQTCNIQKQQIINLIDNVINQINQD